MLVVLLKRPIESGLKRRAKCDGKSACNIAMGNHINVERVQRPTGTQRSRSQSSGAR